MKELSTNQYGPAEKHIATRSLRYAVVEEHLVDVLRSWRAQDNSASLMTQLGISYNTWRKVQAGQPVRQSVAERLQAHIRKHQDRAR